MSDCRARVLLDAMDRFVAAQQGLQMMPCQACGKSGTLLPRMIMGQSLGHFCDTCYYKMAGAPGNAPPTPNLGGGGTACNQCACVDASVAPRPIAKGTLSLLAYCDACWNMLGPFAPSPVVANRPSQQAQPPLLSPGYMGTMPPATIWQAKKSGASQEADMPHCGQCAHCCNGLIEGCESYAPEAPCEIVYACRGSVYVLQLTGEWMETALSVRYYRVQLPEGEQVPCCALTCPVWFSDGWAYKMGDSYGDGLCGTCAETGFKAKRRSR